MSRAKKCFCFGGDADPEEARPPEGRGPRVPTAASVGAAGAMPLESLVDLVPPGPELLDLEPVDKDGKPVDWWTSQRQQPGASSSPSGRLLKQVPPESVLGKGAFGVVWRARDVKTGQLLAVKNVKLTKATSVTLRECQIADLIRKQPHPCIVKIQSVHHFKEEKMYTLVMEFCGQGTITSRVFKQRAWAARAVPPESKQYMAPKQSCMWLSQVFLSLEHLHIECQMLLRDLKPDNVVLDERDNAKITDFGFGKAGKYSGEWTFGHPAGTPGYIAPELLRREDHDFRADLFSFGVLTWLLFTGGVEAERAPQPPTGRMADQTDYRALFNDWQKLALQAQSQAFGAEPDQAANARDLVLRLVKRDPAERLNHDEIREHPLIAPMRLPPREGGVPAVEAWIHELQNEELEYVT